MKIPEGNKFIYLALCNSQQPLTLGYVKSAMQYPPGATPSTPGAGIGAGVGAGVRSGVGAGVRLGVGTIL